MIDIDIIQPDDLLYSLQVLHGGGAEYVSHVKTPPSCPSDESATDDDTPVDEPIPKDAGTEIALASDQVEDESVKQTLPL